MAIPLTDSSSELLRLCDHYQKIVEATGKTVYRSTRDVAIKMFQAMSEAQRLSVQKRLETEIAVLSQMASNGEKLTDSGKQLWKFLKINSLTPCSDLFDKLTEKQCIQVFGPEQTLLFASSNIFDFISFTVEQLYTQTWYECTKRDSSVEQTLAQVVLKAFAGEFKETFNPGVPFHEIQEVNTAKLIRSSMDIPWMSPVFAEHKVAALIVIVEGDLL